jgi:hypothetical protein
MSTMKIKCQSLSKPTINNRTLTKKFLASRYQFPKTLIVLLGAVGQDCTNSAESKQATSDDDHMFKEVEKHVHDVSKKSFKAYAKGFADLKDDEVGELPISDAINMAFGLKYVSEVQYILVSDLQQLKEEEFESFGVVICCPLMEYLDVFEDSSTVKNFHGK